MAKDAVKELKNENKIPVNMAPKGEGTAMKATPKFSFTFEQVQQLEQILNINAQAEKIGTLDYRGAYGGLTMFIKGNLKKDA